MSLAAMDPKNFTLQNEPQTLPKITWDGIAFHYFAAYYKGEFIDRTGGKLSKPDIGKKISNETITSALTVGIESIYDFAVLSASKGPEDLIIKAPIVFSGDAGKEQFQTADHNKPTLAVLSQKLLGQQGPIKEWPYVVERVKNNDKVGISPAKIKVIRWASGVAGDGAGSLSDLIMRTFGGINLGVTFGGGLLGKVSIGDDDTLAKIVATTVESVAHRGSELFVGHMLYGITFDDPRPKPEDSLAVLLLKYIVILDGAGDI
jgi:hypothetical protein